MQTESHLTSTSPPPSVATLPPLTPPPGPPPPSPRPPAAVRGVPCPLYGPARALGHLLGVELACELAGKDDLALVVVRSVGEELGGHGLPHLPGEPVGDGGLHAEEYEAGIDLLYGFDDRARERLVAGRDHVEGAVGLDVLDVRPVEAGGRGARARG